MPTRSIKKTRKVFYLARLGEYGKALSFAAPFLKQKIPADISMFYTFVGDQDLLSKNSLLLPWTTAERRRVVRALKALPDRPERGVLSAYAEMCALRPRSAIKILEKIRKFSPSKLSMLKALSWWLLGDCLRDKRWLQTALVHAEKAVSLGDNSRQAVFLRAQVRFEIEDNEGGLADLETLLRRDPGDMAARIGKVEKLTDSHQYGLALKEANGLMDELRCSKKEVPWWAFAQRGRLHGLAGNPKPALADLNRAIDAQPRLGSLYCWRAEVWRRTGSYRNAMKDLNKAVFFGPDYALSWEVRGRLRLMRGNARGAYGDLDQACRLDPTHWMPFVWRGEAAFKTGRFHRAWCDFEAAAPLEPRTTWNPVVKKGEILTREGRERAFWEDLDGAARKNPENPAPYLFRGRFRVSCGRIKEGFNDLSSAVELSSVNSWVKQAALSWRGYAFLRLGDVLGALRDLSLKQDMHSRCWRAEALLLTGHFRQALKELNAALIQPKQSVAFYYLLRAKLNEKFGSKRQAVKDFEQAYVLNPRMAGLPEAFRPGRG